jgi:hypothetical protein
MSAYTDKDIAAALQEFITAQWGEKQGRYKAAARAMGVGQVEISMMVHGHRPPPRRVLQAMGLERVVTYVARGEK